MQQIGKRRHMQTINLQNRNMKKRNKQVRESVIASRIIDECIDFFDIDICIEGDIDIAIDPRIDLDIGIRTDTIIDVDIDIGIDIERAGRVDRCRSGSITSMFLAAAAVGGVFGSRQTGPGRVPPASMARIRSPRVGQWDWSIAMRRWCDVGSDGEDESS